MGQVAREPKTIDLPAHGIQIALVGGGGTVICVEDLYELCPHCGQKDCCFQCDDSTVAYHPADSECPEGQKGGDEDEDAVRSRLAYNGAVDGIMSMILAHAIAGIDIQSPVYLEGIETALQGAAENS